MPDWLAHLFVPICGEAGRRGQAAPPRPRSGPELGGRGWRPQEPTWSPMTHWPAFMVASSKLRSCFSEYLTPMSTPLCSPFVLAWRGGCWEYQGGAAGTLNPLGIALRLTPGPPAAPPSHRRAQLRTGVLTSHPLPPSITSRYPTLQRPTCSPHTRPRPSPLPGPPASTPHGASPGSS